MKCAKNAPGRSSLTALARCLSGLLLLLLLLGGCNGNEPSENEIVARVGEAFLTRNVVQSLLPEGLSGAHREAMIIRIVEQWIDNQVIARKAHDQGFEITAVDRWQVANLRNELLATRYMEDKTRIDFAVTDLEIEDYYNNNAEQYKRSGDEVHLVHLYLEKLDNAIVKEIREAKSLLTVIQKNYNQTSRVVEPNGDLGYVPVAGLREAFRKAIRGTKTGIIYGEIRTRDGYHYLQVLDRKSAGTTRSLDLVRQDILKMLQYEKRREFVASLKESARKEYKVETFYDNIL